jgi:diguanylate cyclase (GGDEF)-like protein
VRHFRGRAWQALIGACALLTVPAFLRPGSVAAEVSYLAGLTLIAAGLVAAARSLGRDQRRTWMPWVAGVVFAITGSAVAQLSALVNAPPSWGNVSLVCWIAFYLPFGVAIVRMIEGRAVSRPERVAIIKDVAVVTAAATVLAWDLLIQPALAGAHSAGLWALLATLGFPLGDVGLLALAITVLLLPGRRVTSERLIVVGLAASLPIDFMIALAPETVSNASSWLNVLYLLVHATLTAAVLHPDRSRPAQPAERGAGTPGMPGWRMVLLGTALCGVGLSAILVTHQGWDGVPSAAAILVMIALILSRLHRAVADLGRAERTLRYQATHDQLTGLANRSRLLDEMRHVVHRSPALFFVDLDGFKAVNDTRGHHCGDEVLRAVAARLTGIVRGSDTVARLGGDEFVVVCTGLTDDDVATLAVRIERLLSEPIGLPGGAVTIGASIGILSLRDTTGTEIASEDLVSELLRAADAAMYEAKRNGGGTRTVEYVAERGLTGVGNG